MDIKEAGNHEREAITNLLRSQKLPSEDLPLLLNDFYVAVDQNEIIATIGLERYEQYGLLRSMVVHPDHRNKRIAEALVQLVEAKAIANGIHTLYLLTETAAGYFAKKGYAVMGREEVPDVVRASSEFSQVCPVSATVMGKALKDQPIVKL